MRPCNKLAVGSIAWRKNQDGRDIAVWISSVGPWATQVKYCNIYPPTLYMYEGLNDGTYVGNEPPYVFSGVKCEECSHSIHPTRTPGVNIDY